MKREGTILDLIPNPSPKGKRRGLYNKSKRGIDGK